jgi:hypothetical protein
MTAFDSFICRREDGRRLLIVDVANKSFGIEKGGAELDIPPASVASQLAQVNPAL